MTKAWLSLAAGAATAALVGACGAPTPVAIDPDVNHIVTQGKVRVCSTGDYRPFTYRDAHGWSGMDIELAHDLAKNLGVELDLEQTTWESMVNDLGTKCDMAMGGITITLERARHALYSLPYLRDGKAAIVRCADSAKYQTLREIDQPGVRVVVNPGGTNADFDKANIHQAKIIEYPDNNTIFQQVLNNNADVMLTDASEIRYQTKQNPQLCGPSVDHPFTFEQKAYLFPRNDPTLQQWVDNWLTIDENDGTYAYISQKWFGQPATP
jgi:cyclohexadienyl dehydratase